jgi:hypothetical protein
MSRHEVDDLTIWFGTADAPAPLGAGQPAAPPITVAVSPAAEEVAVIVRHRRAGGPWRRLLLEEADRSAEARYLAGVLPFQPPGTQVDYEIHVRRAAPRPTAERRVGTATGYSVAPRGAERAEAPPGRPRAEQHPVPVLAAGEVGPDVIIAAEQAQARFAASFAQVAGAIPETRSKDGRVVWVRGDDEVLVQAHGVRLIPRDGFILIAIPVYTDQTGSTEVVVTFATGRPGAGVGLIMGTEPVPRGDALVVEAWGDELTAAAWETLISVVTAAAAEAGVDDDHEPLLPAVLAAGAAGLVVTPQARHSIDRRSAPGLP